MTRALKNIAWKPLRAWASTQLAHLLALQPLLKLHSQLLGGVCSWSHDAGSGVHSLERKAALLANLIHHRVKRWWLSLEVKASLHRRTLGWVRLSIQCCLLIHHHCCFLTLKNILFGLQSLPLKHQTQMNSEVHLRKQPKANIPNKVKKKKVKSIHVSSNSSESRNQSRFRPEAPQDIPLCWEPSPSTEHTHTHTQSFQ